MILFSKDVDDDERNSWQITGPRGLSMLPEVGKAFLSQKKIRIEFTPATDPSGKVAIHQGKSFTITAVELMPSADDAQMEVPLSDYSESSDDDEEKQQQQQHKPKHTRLRNPQSRIESVVAYVGKLASIRGKFDPKKAIELGLRPGHQYSTLTKGIPVTTPEGDTVYPHQVMEPDQPGPEFIILECPSIRYLPDLISNSLLQTPQVNPVIVVHITPREVFQTAMYQSWLRQFNCKHLLLHGDFCPQELSLKSCFNVRLPLHLIDPTVFHLPSFAAHAKPNSSFEYTDDPSIIIGQNSLVFHLRPLAKLGLANREPVKTMVGVTCDALTKLISNDHFIDQLEHHPRLKNFFEMLIANTTPSSIALPAPVGMSTLPMSGKGSFVTFLGTASTYSSRYRNVSSILLHLPNAEYMLMDVGEGTLGQMYKCFGPDFANNIISRLRCVFITHIHGDHCLGLFNVLRKRKELVGSKSVLVIGPRILKSVLKKYSCYIDKLHYDFQLPFKADATTNNFLEPLLSLGITSINVVPVMHIPQSYGIVICHKDGWKLVYSGDTRPCAELVQAGKGATVLIHEATFHHGLLDDAIAKRHSTDLEAQQVANDMKAEFLMLTHFSQRYSQCQSVPLELLSPSVGIAFDYMTVQLDNLKELQRVSSLVKNTISVLDEV
jgi:ribonuclease Z